MGFEQEHSHSVCEQRLECGGEAEYSMQPVY